MEFPSQKTMEEIRKVIPDWIIAAVERCEDPSTQAELLAASAWLAGNSFTEYAALMALARHLLPSNNIGHRP